MGFCIIRFTSAIILLVVATLVLILFCLRFFVILLTEHIALYKGNNAVSCCNTCSDAVLFKILCYLLTESVNTRLKNQHKTLCFSRVFELREFITQLLCAIRFSFNLADGCKNQIFGPDRKIAGAQ